jgi:hypothetical protein
MAKEKKERAKKYEPKIQHNLSFNQMMKIAANPKPKVKPTQGQDKS